MKAVLFDLDGVFYEGDRPVAGGADTIHWVRERRIPHVFLTNTTSKGRGALVEKLAGMGIETDAGRILTPPVAALAWLRDRVRGPVALYVPPAIEHEFSTLSLWHPGSEASPGALVLGDLGERWDYALLNRAFRQLMSEPRPYLVALGMTRYWKAADGFRLDVAPFVVALEHATGIDAVVLGKPSAEFYGAALQMLDVDVGDTVIVGDDIRSDIGGAQRCGIHGILVRTGKFRPADLEGDVKPHAVLDSVADLPGWWDKNSR